MKKQVFLYYFPNLSDPLTAKLVLQSVLGFFLIHFIMWGVAAQAFHLEWSQLLNHWDSQWYSEIVQEGYTQQRTAFYPLYPFLVKGVEDLFGGYLSVSILGTLVSTLLFLSFCGSLFATKNLFPLCPKTNLGWLLFLFWPGSMIFHSHHTESLFLFLTFWAFAQAQQRRWILASMVAGLCALTRSHGVLVAITVGVWAASQVPATKWGQRILRFVVSGCVSGAFFSLYPLFQYYRFGDPFIFLKVQASWAHARTWQAYMQTLLFMNRQSVATYMELIHYVFFLWLCAWFVYFRKQHSIFSFYLLLVLLLMPAQGELINVFRFGAVLFPILFIAGDWLATSPNPWVKRGVLFYFVLHNMIITMNYAAARWSY